MRTLEQYFEDAKHRLRELEEELLELDEDLGVDCDLVDTKMVLTIAQPRASWVLSTNSGARQLWIAALTKSWKLDEDGKGGFVLKETGQDLRQVVEHCLSTHFGKKIELRK